MTCGAQPGRFQGLTHNNVAIQKYAYRCQNISHQGHVFQWIYVSPSVRPQYISCGIQPAFNLKGCRSIIGKHPKYQAKQQNKIINGQCAEHKRNRTLMSQFAQDEKRDKIANEAQ